MTQEIEIYSKIQNPIEAVERIGIFFAKSGMFGCDRPEQGMVLAMACLAERKSPIEIKRRYHLYNGELSMRADAMLADFRTKARGKHKAISRTPERAAVELTIDGNSYLFEFTWADAEKEPFIQDRHGKVKTNYATPRARMQMLWARAVSDGVHTVAPEIVAGVYTREELDTELDPGTKPLFQTPAASSPTAGPQSAKAKAAKIIDVSATPVPQTETPPPTPPVEGKASAAAAAPDPQPTPAAPQPAPKPVCAATNPQTGCITAETAQAIQALVPAELEAPALKWLESKKWIKPMGSLLDLRPDKAQMILNEPAHFIRTVRAFAAKTAQACAPASAAATATPTPTPA